MLIYRNNLTGEITEEHAIAMSWFREHSSITLLKLDKETGNYKVVGNWTWD